MFVYLKIFLCSEKLLLLLLYLYIPHRVIAVGGLSENLRTVTFGCFKPIIGEDGSVIGWDEVQTLANITASPNSLRRTNAVQQNLKGLEEACNNLGGKVKIKTSEETNSQQTFPFFQPPNQR